MNLSSWDLRARFRDAAGDQPVAPLGVLFLLNLVDEIDQVAFGIVAPDIRDTFGVAETTIISLAAVTGALVIMLAVPVGIRADRVNRVRLVTLAALAWGSMTVLTGLSGFVGAIGLLVIARFGAGLGRVMNEPVHTSLLADWYPATSHGKVFSLHRMANPLGTLSVLACGLLADLLGWRLAFILLAIPTLVAVTLVSRLEEPLRGASLDVGAAALAKDADAVPFSEARRRLKAIPSLRRTWLAGFFIGGPLVSIAIFFNFFLEQEFGIDSASQRAAVIMLFGAGSVVGLLWGSRLSTEALVAGDLPRLPRLAGQSLLGAGLGLMVMAVVPWLPLAGLALFAVGAVGGRFNSFALPVGVAVAPPRLRSQAFGWFVTYVGLGAVVTAPIASGIGENAGYRWGIGIMATLYLVAGITYATVAKTVSRDADQAFQTLLVEAGLQEGGEEGADGALLTCRRVEVAYDQVQVLFGVDLEVRPGEIVALLGTNGAGKSTLLKAVSGTVDPIGGAIFFDGRDVTHADAVQTATLGIIQVPGGKAVFPTLTVAEHLRAAGWLHRKDVEALADRTTAVLELFPRLRERIHQQAGNLSGGEQQMLAIGMALIGEPKLLIIDELSLGLAPSIVAQLLDVVRDIRATGVAVLLVEQSVNVALSIADRAYFLEKGEVRFTGPTEELVGRDDIVRSVFLAGAAAASTEASVAGGTGGQDEAGVEAADDVVLRADGLIKRFGGITAVDGVSFELHRDEILGFLGANGAGKTTVFDLLSGFLPLDGGRIELAGRDVSDLAPDRRAWLGLGRSFQDARLVPSLSVAENIALGLERHLEVRDHAAAALGLPGLVRQEDDVAWTVADLVELLGLGAYRDKFVRELSTGTRRIVDLAMCIGHDPAVLLLDEPSSGIAQRETEALGPVIQRIRREAGCAILLIEHDMPLLSAVSDRVVALELGSVLTIGTPGEVLAEPRVVASYLGGDPSTVNRSGATGPAAPTRRRSAPLATGSRS